MYVTSYTMRKSLLLLLLLPICFVIAAKADEHRADSLLQEAQRAPEKSKEQAVLYLRAARAIMSHRPETALLYARQGIAATGSNKWYETVADGYIVIGHTYNSLGRNDEIPAIADTIVFFSEKVSFKEGLYSAAILKGENMRKKARYDEALNLLLHAVHIAEGIEHKWYLGNAFHHLAILYTTLEDLPRARDYYLHALKIWQDIGSESGIQGTYGSLGILYRDRGMYDSALQYYRKAAAYPWATGDSSWIAFSCNDIGAAHSFLGNYDSSEYYLKTAIGIRERMNERHELPYTYNYLGENYERKKDLTNAEQYIRKAVHLSEELGNNKQTYQAYESLSDFFARNGRYDSAYRYAMIHKAYKDSFVTSMQRETIADLTTKYETEKKERIIQEQQLAITQKNILVIAISALLLIGTLSGYTFYRKKQAAQQAVMQQTVMQQQELAAKAVIVAEENERKRIAADLHDSVGQLMSAAKLNLSTLKSTLRFDSPAGEMSFDKAIALVDESCREVRTVSHHIMPNALLKAGLASAIRSFIDKIDQRIIQVQLYTEGFNERMDNSVESVLYRIIQECVNNVIRHSGAHKLDIALVKDGESISVTVEDNGRGFDTGKKDATAGIGMKNIRSRVEYLKGTVEWDSAPGKGTVVAIYIPAKG